MNIKLLTDKRPLIEILEKKEKLDIELVKLILIDNINAGGNEQNFIWLTIFNSINLAANHGYITKNDITRIILSMPTINVVEGEKIILSNKGVAGFKIQQQTGQQIRVGNKLSTVGVQGSISSTDYGDYIEFTYLDNLWTCTNLIGNIQIL